MANEPKTDKQQAEDVHKLVEDMNNQQADSGRRAHVKTKGKDDG